MVCLVVFESGLQDIDFIFQSLLLLLAFLLRLLCEVVFFLQLIPIGVVLYELALLTEVRAGLQS